MESYDHSEDDFQAQIAIKIHTIKFLEERIDELLCAARDDSVASGVEDEVYMFFSQGLDTLKAEIIDLERDIHRPSETNWDLDAQEGLKDAIQCLKVILVDHNLVSVSGGNAWLVQKKLADAYSYGIEKLEDEMAESKKDAAVLTSS